MARTQLVVSDVDGTLLTKEKVLTDRARDAVRKLHDAGVAFTITSSRPTIGMRLLIDQLAITLPFGAFNGSSIVDPHMNPIEEHLIPSAAAAHSIDILKDFGVDIWLFTNDKWLTCNADGEYVGHERHAIKADPTIVADFAPYSSSACKIVGSSSDAALLERCESFMRKMLGGMASIVRSQAYYLDITPPGCDKGTFVESISKRLGVTKSAITTVGDMNNDLPMFRNSGVSIAMGNAPNEVKKLATCITASNENEGFAGAVEMILNQNRKR